MKSRLILSAFLLPLLLAVPLLAQNDASQQEIPGVSQFADIVDVRVVNLELVVTRRGERIEGLTSDDFRLLVDGEEFPIEFFSEVRYGTAVPSDDAGDVAAVPALAPGEEVGTNYLVFIDDVFAIAPYRNRILKRLNQQVDLMGPKDRMALVAFDGRRIEMLSSWTRSASQLDAAIDEAIDRPTHGLMRRSLERTTDQLAFEDTRRFPYLDPRDRRLPLINDGLFDLDAMVNAASASLRGFANPEGRKVMLMLSGGWDPSIWEWDAFSAQTEYGYIGERNQLYGPLIDTANRLGYTLYPVEVGPVDSGLADASIRGLNEAVFNRRRAAVRDWNQEGVLFQLADETGGRAYVDGTGINVLQSVQDDTSSYYWLGFTPDWQANDLRHRVQVVYKGKGKVRTRKSFSDLSRSTETTMQMESAQLFDLPLPSKADLVVQVGTPEQTRFRKVVVPIEVEIPLDEITLLQGGQGWSGQLELRVAVTDDRGSRADIPTVPVDLFFPEKPGPGATSTYETGLKMRKRPHSVLISLHDVTTGETLATKLDLAL